MNWGRFAGSKGYWKEMDIVYVGYGIGNYYSAVNKEVREKIKLSYLCDKKWDDCDMVLYDETPIISRKQLKSFENVKVVIFSNDYAVCSSIADDLNKLGVEYILATDLLGRRSITGEEIKKEGKNGIWKDTCGNRILYDETLPDRVQIVIGGIENMVRFGSNILINQLCITLGNKGRCEIGNNTRIIDMRINVAYAAVCIGEDCLFSSNIIIRTQDEHCIFDKDSLIRINDPTDVRIEDQIWICENVRLLPGAKIGTGSVVGANAVTSGQFGEHVIIAGVPAKVIRENICWSKDNTFYTNPACFDECTCKDARKYF